MNWPRLLPEYATTPSSIKRQLIKTGPHIPFWLIAPQVADRGTHKYSSNKTRRTSLPPSTFYEEEMVQSRSVQLATMAKSVCLIKLRPRRRAGSQNEKRNKKFWEELIAYFPDEVDSASNRNEYQESSWG
jgi:hypothetical protein